MKSGFKMAQQQRHDESKIPGEIGCYFVGFWNANLLNNLLNFVSLLLSAVKAGEQDSSTFTFDAATTFKEVHELYHTTVSRDCNRDWNVQLMMINCFPSPPRKQILLSQWQAPACYHNRNDRTAIGAGIQSIRKLRDTSRQISHCRHRVSSAIVLESAIVHVYAINQDGLCEWKPFSRLLAAVSSKAMSTSQGWEA